MEPAVTLAQHLRAAARRTPAAPALLTAHGSLDYAGLNEEAARQAAQLAASCDPVVLPADNLTLARTAYACSVAARPFWPLAPDSAPPPLPVTGIPPDTAWVISTSGSEGRPKAVPLSNANLDAAAAASNARLPLGSGDIWLDCLPLCHIGGLSILWRCARAGAAVLLHDGFDALAVARDLAGGHVTHVSLVPAMLARLLDIGTSPPPSLRCALLGGAALSRPLFERARATGWPIFATYGMSETTAQVATIDAATDAWHEGLVGRPLPGVDIAIAADGRIRVRGPQVMAAYLEGGGIDADGWFATGDLGRLDTDGRLTVLGRADDMLVSGGHKVHPLEIESCLAACPGVADIAVTGQPDPVWGDIVVALVVGSAEAPDILDWSRARLPAAARPRRVLHLDHLPRNAMGKIDRAALRRLAGAAPA